jgi:CMP-N,N'-diacetyllegionaminic acid synthase
VNVLCVITARGGSKGLPGKNVKLLGAKPLIAYSIDAAKNSDLITHAIVSTDDPEIAEVSKQCGADVPFMRPAELATDSAGHLGVMQHAIAFMEAKLNLRFDVAVIFQPTSPFRTKEDVDGTLQKLIDHPDATASVSVYQVETAYHPIKMKKLDGDWMLPFCMEEPEGIRRQDIPPAYRRASSVYATRRDVMMEQNRLFGDKIVAHITPAERFADIDTPLDWLTAEHKLAELQAKGQI